MNKTLTTTNVSHKLPILKSHRTTVYTQLIKLRISSRIISQIIIIIIINMNINPQKRLYRNKLTIKVYIWANLWEIVFWNLKVSETIISTKSVSMKWISTQLWVSIINTIWVVTINPLAKSWNQTKRVKSWVHPLVKDKWCL